MSDPVLPPRLRDEVTRTLAPVRPLRPLRRALLLAPLAAAVVALAPWVRGLRWDAEAVGAVRLWGGSALEAGAALMLLAAALSESVPGRLSSPGRLALRAALAGLCLVMISFVTFDASATRVPGLAASAYDRICTRQPFLLGLLPLAVTALALRRGLAARPALAGALAGLGAGLLAESGWRLHCEVSDPAHVFTTHAVAVLALAGAGTLGGSLAASVRRLRVRRAPFAPAGPPPPRPGRSG
jgi:hypothetical protein